MNLSEQAITELKEALHTNIGDQVDTLSETELQKVGFLMLTIIANSLKIRSRQNN